MRAFIAACIAALRWRVGRRLGGIWFVPVATVAVLIGAAAWLLLASLFLPDPTAYVVLAAGVLSALSASTVSVLTALRVLLAP